MHILGIVPARGGSNSIPKKNIAPLGGKPLLYYTIRAIRESKLLTRSILSTDDAEIAQVARRYGLEVPFMRPRRLAQDRTPDLPVFQHALRWLARRERYSPEIIVHLRPTSPFKSGKDIDRAIQMLLDDPEADSARSVRPPHQTPFKMWTIDGRAGKLIPLLKKAFPDVFKKFKEPYDMPRQLLPAVWEYSAYIEALRRRTIMEKNSMSGERILPFRYEERRDVDIDSFRELRYAEIVLKDFTNE